MISLSVNLVLWCNSLEHFVSINLLLTGCMRLWLNICLCLVSSGGDFVSQPWWTTSPSQSDSMVSMASVHRNRRPPANSFCMPTLRSDLLLTPNSVVVIQYFYLKWRKKWTTPWNNREASHFRAISKRIVNSVCIVCLCYAAIFFNHFSLGIAHILRSRHTGGEGLMKILWRWHVMGGRGWWEYYDTM